MNIAAKRVLLAPAKTPARQRPGTAWHKNALEIARELAGLPTLVTVVASFCTESQEVLAYWALGALLVAIGLRFLPGIAKGKLSIVAPWLVTALLALTLVLVLVVVPRRAGKKGTSLKSWLKWQNSLEIGKIVDCGALAGNCAPGLDSRSRSGCCPTPCRKKGYVVEIMAKMAEFPGDRKNCRLWRLGW